MRIYVDIDDVLCETAASLCEIVAREFGRHVAYEDVFQFDLQDVFRLTDEEMRDLSWSGFVSAVTEPELIRYLKERRLYVNDPVCGEVEL